MGEKSAKKIVSSFSRSKYVWEKVSRWLRVSKVVFKRFKKRSGLRSFRIKRNAIYAVLIGLVLGAYVLSFIGLNMLFSKVPELSLLLTALAIVIAAIGFAPLEKKIQAWTDRVFFRKRFDYHKTIQSISRAMTSIVQLDALYELLVMTIYKEMRVKLVELFIDNKDGNYVPVLQRGRLDREFSSISSTDPLVCELRNTQQILVRSQAGKEKLQAIPILRWRRTELYIPLFMNEELLGFLSVGEKLSGEPYYQEDLYSLETLANQALVGIQNTRSFRRSENKMIEMKTVSDVGRIISSSLDLQNILDTIIKSVIEVVGVDRGMLLLYDERSNSLQAKSGYGASLEEISKVHLPVNESIFGQIFKSGKPVRQKVSRQTEHVLRLHVDEYIAVPMKTKDKIIGLIAIDNKLSGESLEKVNMELLVTLANQTAMAIDNAKLYEETRQVKNYNENILKYMTSGVITIDSEGKIKTFNKQAELITGVSLEEAKQKNINELWAEHKELLATFSAPKQNIQIKFKENAGEDKYVSISTVRLNDHQNKSAGMLAVLTDMTELKNLEDQVRRSDRLSALGTMAAGLAHEIKNPLASMKLFVQLMSESWKDPEFWKNYGGIIGAEVERLSLVVEDFLGFARSYELKDEVVPLGEVLEKVKSLLKNQLLKSNIKFEMNRAEDLSKVKIDQQRMTQVFMNLILNAMQAFPEEKLDKKIEIKLREGSNFVQAELIDNGPGISKEHLEKLFTPFFTTKKKGTGLGLSIVHRIVEEHGGKISVQSEVGRGTIFTIELPKVSDTEQIMASIEDSTANTSPLLTPVSIY
ncbi:ATP-binding protein [Candidatus Margulisiibacteriota bacterium]